MTTSKKTYYEITAPTGTFKLEYTGSMIYVRKNGELISTREVDEYQFGFREFAVYAQSVATKLNGSIK